MKPVTIDDIRKAIVIRAEDGTVVSGVPAEGRYEFSRANGPAQIPVQLIVRELQLAYPKAHFLFVAANVPRKPKKA